MLLQDFLADIDGREQVSITINNHHTHFKYVSLNTYFLNSVYDKIIGKAVAGESFGEIGALLGRPQPYAFRTAEISQILCLSKKTLLNILRDNPEDERIIMRNLVQVFAQGYEHKFFDTQL